MFDNRTRRVGLIITCVLIGIIGAFLLIGWIPPVIASPQAPGVELGPDHTRQVSAGQVVIYQHTLANTGTTTDTFWLQVASTQGWAVELLGGNYPTGTLGTLVLPQVGAQITASFQVSLTVPRDAAGVTEITIVTATSLLSPTASDSATDITIVLSQVYLPVIVKHWPPIPYPPMLNPIDNAGGDGAYTITWTEQPLRLADVYTLQEATNTTFTAGLRDVCTTAQQSCNVNDRLAGKYYYRVQGHNSWGYGGHSNVEKVVVLPPDAPALDNIANRDEDGRYSVTWSAPARATSYTLQEDTDPKFGDPGTAYDGAKRSWSTSSHAIGTYYYRVRADGPTGQSKWSNVQSVTVLLTPYNLEARQIVLKLSDMPFGYVQEKDGSGPVEFSDKVVKMGVVTGHEAEFVNEDLILSGTYGVYNLAAVFNTPQGARSYLRLVEKNVNADPEYKPVSSPTLGDETIAYKGVFEDGLITIYLVSFRKGNMVENIITGAWSPVASIDDTLLFAEIVLGKIDSQVNGRMSGVVVKRELKGAEEESTAGIHDYRSAFAYRNLHAESQCCENQCALSGLLSSLRRLDELDALNDLAGLSFLGW